MAEPQRSQDGSQDGKSLPILVREFVDLVVAYLKQETLDPLKALGRFVAYGLAGAVFFSLGAVLVGIGGLRAIQTETRQHWTGDWPWVPYVVVAVVYLAVVVFVVSRIAKVPRGQAR